MVAHDAEASSHEAGDPEEIDVSAFAPELLSGENVLAVQGVNAGITSRDFSLIPVLEIGAGEVAGCGDSVYVTGGAARLSGRSNACETRAVRVDGRAVEFDTFRASWSAAVNLLPGDNLITVEALNALGVPIDATEVLVRRIPGTFTPLGGEIAADTVWRAADGPFLMTSDVRVPAGRTLDIEEGTLIFAEEDASIIVEGELTAEGTQARPILFRSTRCDERWGGIALVDTGTGDGDPTHVLRHCDIRYGEDADGAAGCVAPTGSRLLIDSCSFSFLTANAVDGRNARIEVRDSLFENIQEGVHGTSSTVIVTGSTFRGMIGDKDGIDFDGDGGGRSLIEACVFVDGSDDGIDLGSATVDIRDNLFINVQDKGISLERNGSAGSSTISGNVIYNCGTAIALKSGVDADGHNNTLVGNQEGLNLFAKAGASDGGHGAFHSMIIWNNMVDVKLDPLSSIDLSYSNISDTWPGDSNISREPKFMSVPEADFALRQGSPCIGTGKEGVDMGALASGALPGFFVRGDADASGTINLTDAIFALSHLFRGGEAPACPDAADANDDGALDISDPIFTLLHLYAGGVDPHAPFPEPGVDPTEDALACP